LSPLVVRSSWLIWSRVRNHSLDVRLFIPSIEWLKNKCHCLVHLTVDYREEERTSRVELRRKLHSLKDPFWLYQEGKRVICSWK
jgi:hypothetical protein